ncbi:hypothetical protein QUB60_29985 [Microcoleus sp. A2-C5]|uniref:hypothetical protein n=1 Tax=unclassified Microcoleus TaxID=2642155 RepID=UPI002FD2AF96
MDEILREAAIKSLSRGLRLKGYGKCCRQWEGMKCEISLCGSAMAIAIVNQLKLLA